jgi:hypothetical protein
MKLKQASINRSLEEVLVGKDAENSKINMNKPPERDRMVTVSVQNAATKLSTNAVSPAPR